MDLSTTYTPTSVTTRGAAGAGAGGGDLFDEYLRKRMAEKDKAKMAPVAPRAAGLVARTQRAAPPSPSRPGGEGPARKSPGQEAVEARAAMDAYEMTRRSAARKPIAGFNYMGWDQGVENLPSWMRPGNAALQVSPEEQQAAAQKARQESIWDDLMLMSRQGSRAGVM